MISKRRFRMFLNLLIGITALGTITGLLFPGEIAGESTNQVIEFNNSIPNFDFIFFLYGYLIIGLTLVSYVGLYRFKAWGRDVFISALILSIPGYFVTFSPPVVSTGLSELMGSILFILYGMLIAVMYLTPVKEFFFEQELEEAYPA